MRLLVLFALTLGSMAALADDAQALGRRRHKNQCCAPVASPCGGSPCGGAVGVAPTPCCGGAPVGYTGGAPVAMPGVVVPMALPGR